MRLRQIESMLIRSKTASKLTGGGWKAIWRAVSRVASGTLKEAAGRSQNTGSLMKGREKQGRRGDEWMDDDARRL